MVYAVHRKPKRLQLPFPLYLQRAGVFSRRFQFHKRDVAIGHQYNSVGNTGEAGTDKLQCQTASIPDCLSQRLLHLFFNHGLELLCISEYRLMCDGR